jgi:serine-type D-Ala-D-Ala carboxypeptidase/endopeptidase (penicillin-binding protein 4)
MKLLWALRAGGWVFALMAILLASPAGAFTNLATLRSNLTAHLDQPRFAAAAWGVKIIWADTGETVFERDAHKLLKPASNAKLYTAALALERLGPEFRIKTSLYSAVRPDKSGTLRGDLIVFGRGDPCFAERFNGGSYSNILKPVVDAIAAAGIQQIKGDLVGDENYFRGPPFGTQWTWDDLQQYYGAEVSALTVQDNVVDLVVKPGPRVGAPCEIVTRPATTYLSFTNRTVTVEAESRRRVSIYRPVGENVVHFSGWMPEGGSNMIDAVSVHRPALWFVTLLKEALVRRGIRVTGQPRAVDWLERQNAPLNYDELVEIGTTSSAPLRTILSRMMKPSQNLYAQLLLLQAGSHWTTPPLPEQTTEDVGLAELKEFLKKAGVRENEVLLEDGAGLSRGSLVTANATVALLQFMRQHTNFATFRDALPVAGVDGTLRNRFRNTAAAGNARAKTGTLRYVNTLSGYMTNRAGENLVFSLMLNNYDGDAARAALDKIVVTLAEE